MLIIDIKDFNQGVMNLPNQQCPHFAAIAQPGSNPK
jgi:hypothetical protein